MTQKVKKVFVVKATLQTQPAAVADGGMKSLPIIDRFEEMLDRGQHLGERFVVIHVNPSYLSVRMKRSVWHCHRVAGAAHADLDLVFLQKGDVISGRILHAAIGMMHQPGIVNLSS